MSIPELRSTCCAILLCITSSTMSAAELQRWSVQLIDDTAVLRASKDTECKFVEATIAALQEAGIERFELRVMNSADKTQNTKHTYSINIVAGTAEITASPDLPYKYLVATIKKLADSGVTRIKFAPSVASTTEVPPEQ